MGLIFWGYVSQPSSGAEIEARKASLKKYTQTLFTMLESALNMI